MDPKAGVSPVTGLTIGWWWKWCEIFGSLKCCWEKKMHPELKINFEIFSLRLIQIANQKILPRLLRQKIPTERWGDVFSSTRSLPGNPTGNEKPNHFWPPQKNTSPKNYDEKSWKKSVKRWCLELRRGALCHADRPAGSFWSEVPGYLPIGSGSGKWVPQMKGN